MSFEILWTAIPGGLNADGTKMKLSVLASLRLKGSSGSRLKSAGFAPFHNWPEFLKKRQPVFEVTIHPHGMMKPLESINIPVDKETLEETLNPKMWSALFDKSPIVRERIFDKYKDVETLSFPAVRFSEGHKVHYGALALNAILKSDQCGNLGIDISSRVLQSMQDTLKPQLQEPFDNLNLYLHPGYNRSPGEQNPTSGGDRNADIQRRQAEIRAQAEAYKYLKAKLEDRSTPEAVRKAIERDLTRFGNAPGLMIKADVLFALLQRHGQENPDLRNEPFLSAGVTQDTIKGAGEYLRFALFHFRPDHHSTVRTETGDKKEYDFHELLSMIGQFPVLLRSLGLVFDLEFKTPADLDPRQTPNGTVRAKLKELNEKGKAVEIKELYENGSGQFALKTQYEWKNSPFIAASKAGSLIVDGMLNVKDEAFRLETIDVDGALIKKMQHAESVARSEQYKTFASAENDNDWPSVRTSGIALLFDKREEQLKKETKNGLDLQNTFKENPENVTLFADDLVLGYRIDVWDNHSKAWHSLCERTGKYEFQDADDGDLKPWEPDERHAHLEEGFIQTAVTTSIDAENQLQAHETIFLWNGWSLSVGFPAKEINPSKPVQNQRAESDQPLRMKPKFKVKRKSLPPLRFGTGYKVRCRVVDLAGNGLALKDVGDDAASIGDKSQHNKPLVFKFSEPVASPVLLLSQRLDPNRRPGEQMDHLVIRDGQGRSERFIVPPRVSQRTAELGGRFDKDGLIPGAFEGVFLEKDGSFPAYSNDENAPLADRNAYFRYDPAHASAPKCHYYPDPYAKGMLLCFSTGQAEAFDFYYVKDWSGGGFSEDAEWPDAQPIVIRLISSNDTSSLSLRKRTENLNKFDGSSGSKKVRVIEASLPLAARVTVNLSSYLEKKSDAGSLVDASDSAAMSVALIDLIQKSLNKMATEKPETSVSVSAISKALATLTLSGKHPMASPPHMIELVHAVKRPLEAPEFDANFGVKRNLGDDFVSFNGELIAHWDSSSRVDGRASWKDWVDEAEKPGPASIDRSSPVFSIKKEDADRSLGSRPHKIGDTKYHRIEYSLTATSDFKDYYQGGNDQNFDHEFQRSSERKPVVDVPNSKRPCDLDLAYILPTFRWLENRREKYRVRKGGIRIYLRRPWYSSGNGELLGIVLQSESGKNLFTLPFTTQWGLDPIWGKDPQLRGKSLAAPIGAQHFKDHQNPKTGLTLAEFNNSDDSRHTVTAIGYQPKYDENRRLWYCDIQIDSEKSYFPFVRLALARYQPNSLMHAHLSPVLIADFIQLTPDRWANVQYDPRDSKKVTLIVSGASYGASRRKPDESPSLGSSKIRVTVEQRCHQIGGDIGWAPALKANPIDHVSGVITEGVAVWTIPIKLPNSRHWRNYRLLIEEYEEFLSDNQETARRYVYSDIFEL